MSEHWKHFSLGGSTEADPTPDMVRSAIQGALNDAIKGLSDQIGILTGQMEVTM